VLLAAAAPARANEAALHFTVDLARKELRVELRTAARGPRGETHTEAGPRFRVATGTPHHPTPRGTFALEQWVANPRFQPGPEARRRGARPVAASTDGPLGIAKIPFQGAHELHGGAHRYALGKPVTLGCVQLTNGQMRELGHWLDTHGLLARAEATPSGELRRRFLRAATLVIE